MLTSKDLLAAVREAQGLTSNYKLSRFLDVPEKSVQRWNSGRHTPDDPMAVRLAQLAGLDPAEVVACMHAQRSADGPLAEVFRAIAERAHALTLAGLAVILSAFVGIGPDAGAQAKALDKSVAAPDRLCIMSTALRGIFAGFLSRCRQALHAAVTPVTRSSYIPSV